jgi:A/G-specific adenine glycosylase
MPERPTAAALLTWYDRHRRRLPWRALPGETPDPYRVWLSEIMLQQTTVAAVKSYYESFLRRWPTVADLAAAPSADVMAAWAGLGYYARARNLHACAQAVVRDHAGRFPDTEEGLLALPGVGPYTAAAIAAIAFERPATVVDGNVERVMARVFAVTDPLPSSKGRLRSLAAALTPQGRCGDYAQAVMDLGATVCTPRNPACGLCPWAAACEGRRAGIHEDLPRKVAKAPTPTRVGVAFWVVRADGAVLLRRRPARGLLGGMMEVPSTAWRAEPWARDEALAVAPVMEPERLPWTPLPGRVSHTFTHFHLELDVLALDLPSQAVADAAAIWVPLTQLGEAGLPSVMAKIARHALKHVAAAA